MSLFAEMFNEMLMRDFGFRIYKLLVSSPETAEDEKKDKPKEEDKKDKAKSKDDEKKDSSKTRDVDEVKREGSDVEKCDSKRSLQKTQASSKKDEQRETEKMDDNESTQVSSFNEIFVTDHNRSCLMKIYIVEKQSLVIIFTFM